MKNGQEWIRLSTKLIHSKAFGLDNFVHVNQFISENPKKGRGWNRDDIHLTNENWKMNELYTFIFFITQSSTYQEPILWVRNRWDVLLGSVQHNHTVKHRETISSGPSLGRTTKYIKLKCYEYYHYPSPQILGSLQPSHTQVRPWSQELSWSSFSNPAFVNLSHFLREGAASYVTG